MKYRIAKDFNAAFEIDIEDCELIEKAFSPSDRGKYSVEIKFRNDHNVTLERIDEFRHISISSSELIRSIAFELIDDGVISTLEIQNTQYSPCRLTVSGDQEKCLRISNSIENILLSRRTLYSFLYRYDGVDFGFGSLLFMAISMLVLLLDGPRLYFFLSLVPVALFGFTYGKIKSSMFPRVFFNMGKAVQKKSLWKVVLIVFVTYLIFGPLTAILYQWFVNRSGVD